MKLNHNLIKMTKYNVIPNDKNKLISLFGKRTAKIIQSYQNNYESCINSPELLNDLINYLRTIYSTPDNTLNKIVLYFQKKVEKNYNMDFKHIVKCNKKQNSNDISYNLFRTVIEDYRKFS